MALAVLKNVDDINVAVARLQKVDTLMALARIHVGKTSDGINQAPGPMPRLNIAKYNAKANTLKPELADEPRKLNATIMSATNIPA